MPTRSKQGARTTITCDNCKSRKKGCDFLKPSCTRCTRLGLECTYQPRQYAFVEVSGSASTSQVVHLDGASRSISPSSTTSDKSLLATDFSLQAVEAFWTVFLPAEDHRTIGGLLATSWLPVVRDIATTNVCVRQALEACSFAALGFVREDYALARSSMRPYVCALREVNRLLQNPDEAVSDSTLAACRMLSLFEMFRKLPSTGHEEVQTTSWQAHATGAYQLLQLRGIARHTSNNGYNLYDGVRFMGVTQGLGQRQPNKFTELSWLLPQNDLRDELFDLMCSVPAILQDSDRLMAMCSAANVGLSAKTLDDGNLILKRYLATAEALRAWETRALILCNADGAPSDEPRTLRSEYRSHGYAFFYACEQYWAFSLVTYGSYHNFHRCLQGVAAAIDREVSWGPPIWSSPDNYMENIVETCQHFFAPEAGLWTAQAAVFPLSATMIYLLRTGRRDTPEFTTIMNAIASSKAGMIMTDFINNVMSRM